MDRDETIRRGKLIAREYYTETALKEMQKQFSVFKLPNEEFFLYVADCYDEENAPVDLHCW